MTVFVILGKHLEGNNSLFHFSNLLAEFFKPVFFFYFFFENFHFCFFFL